MRSRHQPLQDRLTTAETLLEAKKADAAKLAVDGASDTALDEAETAARAVADRVDTFRTALTEVAAQIVALDEQVAADAEAERREAVAREISELAEQISNATPSIEASIGNFSNPMARAGAVVPEERSLRTA